MDIVDFILLAVGILVASCMTGIFRQQISTVNKKIFQVILSPIALIETGLQTFWSRITQFFGHQLAGKDKQIDQRQIFYEVIGSIVYTFFFLLFGFADFHLICMTLVAMGIEGDFVSPPGSATTITALAFFSGLLFFGLVLSDLNGKTQIAPWYQHLDPKMLKILRIISLVSLALSIIIALLFGYWRGLAVGDDHIDLTMPSDITLGSSGLTGANGNLNQYFDTAAFESLTKTSDDWIPMTVNTFIPLIIISGTYLSGYGIVYFLKYAILGSLIIVSSPSFLLLIIFRYLSRIVDQIYRLSVSLIDLFASMGMWLFGLFKYTPPEALPPGSTNNNRPSLDEDFEPDDDDTFVNPFENRKDTSDE